MFNTADIGVSGARRDFGVFSFIASPSIGHSTERTQDLQITFDRAEFCPGGQQILKPLSLTLSGRRIGVIGLNGSGKTSFSRLAAGLAKPTAGRVTIDGLDTIEDAKRLRGRVGFIFQHPENQIILPVIADDVALGIRDRGLSAAQVKTAVGEVLDYLGIAELASRRPHQLSGGELQLAALAAVLITRPGLIIFDEPTNQLDLRNRQRVARAIGELQHAALVVTHDLPLIEGFERVLVFHEGEMVFDGEGHAAIAHYLSVAMA